MKGPFHHIAGALGALPVLESAARHQSFTKAAAELGLSQPTVSRHILNLEQHFGVPLFTRRHNRLRLTEEGKRIAEAVALGFGHVGGVCHDIMYRGQGRGITLACSFGFAQLWLLPRFGSLRRTLEGHRIQLVTSEWFEELTPEQADVVIRWGESGWHSHERHPLFEEAAYPVCSPGYYEAHPELAQATEQPALLRQHKLLEFDVGDSGFLDWPTWFARQGISYRPSNEGHPFANYQFLLQAVIEGEGIGLGWVHLADDLVARSKLLRIGPTVQNQSVGYHLELARHRLRDDITDRLITWFKTEAGKKA